MILYPDDADRIFKMHKALSLFVGQRLNIAKLPARSKSVVRRCPYLHSWATPLTGHAEQRISSSSSLMLTKSSNIRASTSRDNGMSSTSS
jgi:hypothetical protein